MSVFYVFLPQQGQQQIQRTLRKTSTSSQVDTALSGIVSQSRGRAVTSSTHGVEQEEEDVGSHPFQA